MKIFNKIIVSLILVSSVVFANSVGTITALSGSASIVRGGENIVATLGATLNDKDSVATKENSKVQVIFNDETIVTIGKNSNFSIDEYLYEENKTPTAKFGLVAGAMNTITGKIGKVAPDKFSVKTKTATIGIRGTNFAVEAKEDGSSVVYCTFGAITVTISGETSTVTQGFYTVVSPAGKISTPTKFTPQALDKMRSNSFTSTSSKKEDVKEQSEAKKEDAAELKTEEAKEVSDTTSTITSTDVETPIDTIAVQDIEILVSDLEEQTTDIAQEIDADEVIATMDSYIYFEGPVTNNMSFYFPYGWIGVINNISVPGYITGNIVYLATGYDGMGFDGMGFEFYGALGAQATNDFDVAVTGVYGLDYDPISVALVTDPNSNYIKTTQDDLSPSDAMIWGEWSAHVSYTNSDNYPISVVQNGLWVAGEPTPEDVIESYRNLDLVAEYSGRYMAYSYDNSSIERGDASMLVYFKDNSASLNIAATTFNMEIDGTYMRTALGSYNSADGQFYGAEGKSIGGSFAIGTTTRGVYEVTAGTLTQSVGP